MYNAANLNLRLYRDMKRLKVVKKLIKKIGNWKKYTTRVYNSEQNWINEQIKNQ